MDWGIFGDEKSWRRPPQRRLLEPWWKSKTEPPVPTNIDVGPPSQMLLETAAAAEPVEPAKPSNGATAQGAANSSNEIAPQEAANSSNGATAQEGAKSSNGVTPWERDRSKSLDSSVTANTTGRTSGLTAHSVLPGAAGWDCKLYL